MIMKLIALCPVRNEGWIIGLSARVALLWNDALVILNHGSTDGTVDIIADLQAEFPGRVHCESVPTDLWDEMDHRQMMLERARLLGATHISIVDADEILTANVATEVRALCDLKTWNALGTSMLTLPLYNMRRTPRLYHSSGMWARRETSVVFTDNPQLRWKPSDQFGAKAYQHHRREPQGCRWVPFRPYMHGDGGIMHLWGVTERRLIAKHRAYKIRDRIHHPEMDIAKIDAMYDQAILGRPGIESPVDWQYAEAPDDWWAGYAHLLKHLDLNAVPWQERYCEEMISKYGRKYFEGLNLFGNDQAILGRPGIESPVDWQYAQAPDDWWAGYAHLLKYLDLNAVPWQERYCEEMISKYGRKYFEGLNLFGML